MKAVVITSFKYVQHIGYLDILPTSATKAGATWFIADDRKIKDKNIYFAGDSGNDLEVLTSGCKGIVVRNAREYFRKDVVDIARAKGIGDNIYIAKGGFLGMNGNYAAGIIEGLSHFGIF